MTTSRPGAGARLASWQVALALAGILCIAAYFRTLGLTTWDGTSFLHPDERFIVYTVYNLRVPASVGDYLRSGCAVDGVVPNPSSKTDLAGRTLPPARYEPSVRSGCNTLNPRNYGWSGFFVYGTLPTSLTRLVAELRHGWLSPGDKGVIGPAEIRDVGRSLSALFDLGSVLMTFLIARALYGSRAGLVAGALYALAAFPIQLAHFFTVDAATGFFVLLSVYWAVRAAKGGGAITFLALGVAVGGAMASRITMATLGMLAVVAAGVQLWAPPATSDGARRRSAPVLAALLVLAGAAAALVFRVLAPDSFVGTSFFDVRPDPRFVSSITDVSGYVSGKIDAPFSQQWASRTPFLFPLTNMVVWGMGVPLGAAVWLAWLAAAWQLVRRRALQHAMPVIWVGFYFAWQGGQFGMTMRYYALLYGLLIGLAAWGLVALWDRGERPGAWLRRVAWRVPLAAVLAGTALWAAAFTHIYREPHSRIQASRWIYANIPAGSTITTEVWDDPLPLDEDGGDPNQYTLIKMGPYQEDDEVKYTGYIAADGSRVPGLLDQLDQADYIILSSNRVYGSATRLPMRYPALTRYYHYLFSGELGFELAADVTSYPSIFGVQIPDQGAEEAFSVYDHPRVLIFKKGAGYSRQVAEQLLMSDVAWGEVYKLPTVEVRPVPTALRLTDSQWPAYRAAGTWAQLFGSGLAAQAPWLAWLLAVELLGLAAFALLFRPLAALPDRGFAVAKPLGVLAVAYGAWLLGSARLLPFTPASVWMCAGPLLALGAAAAWAQRGELRAFARGRRGALLAAEGIFLVAFLGFAGLRALNPDLWHPARGGDKPLDLGLLTAVLKSAAFPPYDPFFAGGFMNDRYFGLVLAGAVAHMCGTEPAVAYNLALALFFGLTGTGAFGAAYALASRAGARLGATWRRVERRAVAAGVLAALLVGVAGNLAQAYWMLPGTTEPTHPVGSALPWLPPSYAAQQQALGRGEWAFWDAPRTAGYALGSGLVNEFPAASFLFGDLQPMLAALPLALAALALLAGAFQALTWAAPPLDGWPRGWRGWLGAARPAAGPLLLLAPVVGARGATNAWAHRVTLLLAAAALLVAAWARARRYGGALPELALAGVRVIGLAALGWLLFLPFYSHYASDDSRLAIWLGARTPTAEFLKIDGLWIFALVSAGALLYRRAGRLGRLPILAILAGWALVVLATGLLGLSSVLALVLLVVGGAGLLVDLAARLRLPKGDGPAAVEAGPMSLLLAAWGVCVFALALAPELVTLRNDPGRIATSIDVGLMRWALGGVVAAVAACWAAGQVRRAAPALAWAWRVGAGLLGLAALAFPLTATPARLADRAAGPVGPTLDGGAYMAAGTWSEGGKTLALADDAAAIAWMRANIAGTPIVLEAEGEPYRWAGRVAANTGLPTLLNWSWYEGQQRALARVAPVIESRRQVVADIYGGADAPETLRLLRLYGVEYVYVGPLERALYGASLAKFDALVAQGQLSAPYRQAGAAIYSVPVGGNVPAVLSTTLSTTPPDGGAQGSGAGAGGFPQLGRGGAGSQAAAVALWALAWLAALALGLPIAALAFGGGAGGRRRWGDGGYAWARPIGLVTVGYAVWLPASVGLWRYDAAGLLLGAAAVAAVDVAALAWIGRRAGAGLSVGGGLRALAAHYGARRRQVAQVEGLALAAFLALLALRALNPDLWQPYWGGEKPFEFGLLNATLRSPTMPPLSPFFSGGTINYYYYGFFLVSLAVRATGVAPSVAFNLVIPTLFGMFVSGMFALGARAGGRAWVGLAAAGLVGLSGNLAATFPAGWSQGIGPALAALAGGLPGFGERLGSWFVGPSRVIPNTINEFPLWGFLFADLHPHLIALPLTAMVVALAYECLWAGGRPAPLDAPLARYGLAALTVGTLAVTNSWDAPTYALLLGGALAGRSLRRRGPLAARLGGAAARLALAGALAGAGALLFLPFFQSFRSPVGGVGAVTTPTDLRDYLVVYGLPLAILVPATLGAAWRVLAWRGGPSPAALGFVARPAGAAMMPRALVGALALIVGAAVAAAVAPPVLGALRLGRPAWLESGATPPVLGTRAWLAALLLCTAPVLLSARVSRQAWFAAWVTAVALAVSLGTELVYVRDHLAGGDWYRMNTVFKFGLQVWVLVGLAAALSLPRALRALRRAGIVAETLGYVGLMALALLALVFPAVGVPSRTAYRFPVSPGPTLDGLAFMRDAVYVVDPSYLGLPEGSFQPVPIALRDDGEAIDWLLANVPGAPVVLQSSAEFYRLYGVRVAANTGLPTVVSPLHEAEQRDPAAVYARDGDVQRVYRTADEAEALDLLREYRVEYVYVGPIERLIYGDAGAEKFAAMARAGGPLAVAFRNAGVTIYRVRPAAAPQASPAPAPSGAGSDASLRALEQRLAAAPADIAAAWQLAARYGERGRFADAARVLEAPARANPSDAGLLQYYADMLDRAGRRADSRAAYRQAAAAEPSAANYTRLGAALLTWGEVDEAERALTRAAELGPTEPDAYFFLGQLAEERGDRDGAADHYRRYLELAPEDADMRGDAEGALQRLGR